MPRYSLVLLIGFAMCFASAVLALPEPLIVDVDCAAGDDLAQVLREIEVLVGTAGEGDDEGYDYPSEGPRQIIVQIRGTCMANVTLTLENLTLRGVGDEPAVIQGDPHLQGVVVEARYLQYLVLENLTITGGWAGVRLVHSLASISRCHLSGNGTGLQSENSRSLVTNTDFERNRNAIFTFGGDHLHLHAFLIADNTQAGILADGSSVTLGRGEIRDTRIGLQLQGNATGLLRSNLLIDSSVSVIDSSHLSMFGPATIGVEGQLFVGNHSQFESNGASILANVLLARWGRAFFTDTPIEGEVVLSDFSEVVFDGVGADLLYCDATSDAVCETGAIDTVIGCEHCDGLAPAGGRSDAGFTPPGRGAIRDLLEGLVPPSRSRTISGR